MLREIVRMLRIREQLIALQTPLQKHFVSELIIN
jgi:hypothetical protein